MATLKAFRALRPASPDKAPLISAVPYDVVSTAEARALASDSPLSFLHVSRPEIDLPPGADPYSQAAYDKAASNFRSLIDQGHLLAEREPCIYVYELRMGDHVQAGVAGCWSVAEYDSGVIKKHEVTRKDKEDDRTRHILSLSAQTGPVFLTYKGHESIDHAVDTARSMPPLYQFSAPDGVVHAVWKLSADLSRGLITAFHGVPALYIADGHHRAASAARAAKHGVPAGRMEGAERDFFLAVAFPAGQLKILAYNRTVADLNGLEAFGFLQALGRRVQISGSVSPTPSRKGEICMYIGGRWYLLALPDAGGASDPVSTLDVSILQNEILAPVLGIQDVRTDKRIDFVGGIRGPQALKAAVDAGRAAVAFSMYPVSIDDLMTISDAGEMMPPKSTWFEPKLRDALLIHTI